MWTGCCARCKGRVVSLTGPVEDGAECTGCTAQQWQAQKDIEQPALRAFPIGARVARVSRAYCGEVPAPAEFAVALTSCLPPESERRKLARAGYSSSVQVDKMPTVLTFPLVDEVAQARGISKNKARKVIQRGFVEVNGSITRDPDVRLTSKDVVRIDKAVGVKQS
jgi:hypothetical protein